MQKKVAMGSAIGVAAAVTVVSTLKTVGFSRLVGGGGGGGPHDPTLCLFWYLLVTILITIIFIVCVLNCDEENSSRCSYRCFERYFYGIAVVTTLFFACLRF